MRARFHGKGQTVGPSFTFLTCIIEHLLCVRSPETRPASSTYLFFKECVCVSLGLLGFPQARWAHSRGSWALPTSPYDTDLASWRTKPQVEHRGVRDTHRLFARMRGTAASLAEEDLLQIPTGAARGRVGVRGTQQAVPTSWPEDGASCCWTRIAGMAPGTRIFVIAGLLTAALAGSSLSPPPSLQLVDSGSGLVAHFLIVFSHSPLWSLEPRLHVSTREAPAVPTAVEARRGYGMPLGRAERASEAELRNTHALATRFPGSGEGPRPFPSSCHSRKEPFTFRRDRTTGDCFRPRSGGPGLTRPVPLTLGRSQGRTLEAKGS